MKTETTNKLNNRTVS